MDDKEIKLDLKWFDDLLDDIHSKQMNLFDDNKSLASTGAATISQAASSNIWPYVATGAGQYTLTTNNGTGLSFNDQWDHSHKQSLSVRGDAEFEGDVKIKGKSITEMFAKIEERLAILHPNEVLEAKWEELKALGDKYRELEKDILEKEQIWNTLKK